MGLLFILGNDSFSNPSIVSAGCANFEECNCLFERPTSLKVEFSGCQLIGRKLLTQGQGSLRDSFFFALCLNNCSVNLLTCFASVIFVHVAVICLCFQSKFEMLQIAY